MTEHLRPLARRGEPWIGGGRADRAWEAAGADGGFVYAAIVDAARTAAPCTLETLAREYPMMSEAVLRQTVEALVQAELVVWQPETPPEAGLKVEAQPLPSRQVALYVADGHLDGAVVMSPAYARQLAAQLLQAANDAEDAS